MKMVKNFVEQIKGELEQLGIFEDRSEELINDEALPFSPQSMEERAYLTNLFTDSNYTVISTSNLSTYVTNKTRRIEDLQDLVQEYRTLRIQYLNKYGATTYYETVREDGLIGWKWKRVPLKEKESSID